MKLCWRLGFVSPSLFWGIDSNNCCMCVQVRIFPRTSIDNSRRVRQLAHSLQGQIASAYGKRLAKHMPSIIPTWLAGLHDPDKSVYRAAQESFSKAFSTEEKMRSIWRVYQTPIIEYLHDVVTKESQNTLSDERTTSPDDAATKYSRVVGCAVIINTRLLGKSSLSYMRLPLTCLKSLLLHQKLISHHPSPTISSKKRSCGNLLVMMMLSCVVLSTVYSLLA